MDNRIIIVDDDIVSLINAQKILQKEKISVNILRSGKDLLKYMEKNTADLVLLDILMPEMDGFETYEALRALEKEQGRMNVPVIFLTGENDSETEQHGLNIGASDFIRKPFNKDILLTRIHNTIANSKRIESLTEEASVDKLTGFLNKQYGTAKVTKLCRESTGALAVIDLDSFKLVNDLFGHETGDDILIAFSDIVRKNTRERDVVCRIGGDEFMGFFPELNNQSDARILTERLNMRLSAAADEIMGNDHGIPLGASVGVVMVPEYGRQYEELFPLADSALYDVKQNGKHGCAVYGRFEKDDLPSADDLFVEIDRITKIIEERNITGQALMLEKDSFAAVYRFLMRYQKRYGGHCVKILFSINQENGEIDAGVHEAIATFGRLVQESIRRSDIIMQNRPNQFFVLATEMSLEDVEDMARRIVEDWSGHEYAKDIKVDYAVKSADTE